MKDVTQVLKACDKIIEAYYLSNEDVLEPDERAGVRRIREDVHYHIVRNTVTETIGLAKYLKRILAESTEPSNYQTDVVRDLVNNIISIEDDLITTLCC